MINSSNPRQKQQERQSLTNARGNENIIPSLGQMEDQYKSCTKMVKYKECLKNHAAAIGGCATDGCGEFMPNGEEGTTKALNCSACNCHRNFHRKELECEDVSCCCSHGRSKRLIFNNRNPIQESGKRGSFCSETDEKEAIGGEGGSPSDEKMMMRKRFRTKFTQEQKEKMFDFAERAGWRIQKFEKCVVQKFCEEIGIKRRVLKVWMHNNKHSFAKKNIH